MDSIRLPLKLSRTLYSLVLACLIFFVSIGPSIPRFSYAGDLLFLASLISIGLMLIRIGTFVLFKEQKKLLFILVLFLIYSSIIVVFNGAVDLSYPMRLIRIIVNVLGVASLVYLMHKHFRSDFLRAILMLSYLSISLHGLIMVLEFINPSFRDFVYSITEPKIARDNLVFRMAGLTNGAGAGTSLIQFMAVLMLPLFSKNFRISIPFKILLIATALVNIFAMLVSGRTGLFFTIFFVPLLYFWINMKFTIREKTLFKANIFLAFCPIIIYFFSVFEVLPNYNFFELSKEILLAVNRLFMEIDNVVTSGELRTLTLLSAENRLPDSWLQALFGNSVYERANSNSDIGYVRDIYGLGFVGLMFTSFFYCFLLCDSLFKSSVNTSVAKYIIVLICSLVLAHYKEPFLFTRYFLTVTLLMYFMLVIQSKSRSSMSV